MKKHTLHTAFLLALGLVALDAQAHFFLVSPASWIEQDEKGDPQKMAPCGGTMADGGTRTKDVTEVQGGSMLRLAINETVYHPGHYRVSLARRINLLPDDPTPVMKETENGPRSDHAEIDPNPKAPVLVDGLWANHVQRTGPIETEIRIPNIDCAGCVLQVIQFMESHPGVREGGFSYHHCAVLNITPNADSPIDENW
ncbi:MAG: SCE4755 family polysaccharide monooxygenase-like protein [Pseudomonadota bacterium]